MIYTILVNWNGWRDTVGCLESLTQTRHEGLTVVICDNDSADDSVERLHEWADLRFGKPRKSPDWYPEIEEARTVTYWSATPTAEGDAKFELVLIAANGNLGFAGGNNVGMKIAFHDQLCDYIFLLNNDTEIDKEAIATLKQKMDENPDIAICGSTLVYYDDRGIVQGVGGVYNKYRSKAGHLWRNKPLEILPSEDVIEPQIEYIIGAAIFGRPDFFRRTGGLSEAYFLYYEELDLVQKLRPGERLGWARDSVVAHKVGGSIGTGSKNRASDLSIYYDHRSMARFYWKYLRILIPFMIVRVIQTTLAYSRRGDLRAVRAVWLAMLDVVVRGPSYRRAFRRNPGCG